MERTKLEDFRKENGNIDWVELEKAEMNNGERCSTCGNLIIHSKGYLDECYDCKGLTNIEEEVTHNNILRCPKCKNKFEVDFSEDYELLSQGEHEVSCPKCNYQFEIKTNVEYSFESPELLKEELANE